MKVLIAGATGAIGVPLIGFLVRDGHTVFGLTKSAERVTMMSTKGAEGIVADVLDAESVRSAVKQVRPDAIINELTSLPKHYTSEELKESGPRDKEVRLKGNANLLAAARETDCQRYLLQSAAFWYGPGQGPADEGAALAVNASPAIAAGSKTYQVLETSAQEADHLSAVILRYGFFYGPGTWYTRDGDVGDQVRKGQVPIIGQGQGVWNWVHIEDAALATATALNAPAGVYNICDDQPSEQRVWLPAFARYAGGPEPPRISEAEAAAQAGDDAVYYATRLRAASNAKAKRELGFRPRPLEWLTS